MFMRGRSKTWYCTLWRTTSASCTDQATLASKNCDLFLVLGSSLVVYPAASMPRLAKNSGASLVIINIDPTPMDNIADIVINDSASKVLSAVINGG